METAREHIDKGGSRVLRQRFVEKLRRYGGIHYSHVDSLLQRVEVVSRRKTLEVLFGLFGASRRE